MQGNNYSVDPQAASAAGLLREKIGTPPRLAIILGSGLSALTDEVGEVTRIPYSEIPGFPISKVVGHPGQLLAGTLEDIPVLLMAGRVHYYEGHSMQTVTYPIHVLKALGIETLVITNAAGAINTRYNISDLVCLKDHINWMGDNPLRGTHTFVDLTRAFDPNLRQSAHDTAEKLGITLHSGIYIGFSGPCYETPAEIRAARTLGADVVGMSTVPEVIVAAALKLRVLGFSMITNMAAGVTPEPLSHSEVITNTAKGQAPLLAIIRQIVATAGAPTRSSQ